MLTESGYSLMERFVALLAWLLLAAIGNSDVWTEPLSGSALVSASAAVIAPLIALQILGTSSHWSVEGVLRASFPYAVVGVLLSISLGFLASRQAGYVLPLVGRTILLTAVNLPFAILFLAPGVILVARALRSFRKNASKE